MSLVERFEAVSIKGSQEILDRIESLMPVFTYFEGGEIVIDTRGMDSEDGTLAELTAILSVPESEISDKLVLVYV